MINDSLWLAIMYAWVDLVRIDFERVDLERWPLCN